MPPSYPLIPHRPWRPSPAAGDPRSRRATPVAAFHRAVSAAGRGLACAAAIGAGIAALSASAGPAASAPALAWSTVSGPLPALTDPAMAYDSDTRTVVLFGGTLPDGTPSAQTWLFDGTSWSLTTSPGPPARTGASMAFDAAQHQLILFGGAGSGGALLNDTWAWNGVSWFQEPPGSAVPAVRSDAALAADPAGHLVLFGGTGDAGPAGPATTADASSTTDSSQQATTPAVLGDTWTWDGSQWTQATTSGPAARTGAMATYDPAHNQTVLFGGSAATGQAAASAQTNDTWIWDGATWNQADPAAAPPARSGGALLADQAAGALVLFGGSVSGSPAADAWTWDGAAWSTLAASGAPAARAGVAGAYDEGANEAIIAGGASTAFLALSTAPLTPPPTTTTAPTVAPGPAAPPATAPPPTRLTLPSTTTPATTRPPTVVGTVPGHSTPASTAPAPVRTTPPPAPATPLTGRPGQRVAVREAGFAPFATVQVTLHSIAVPLATVQANGQGVVDTWVMLPPGTDPGSHHLWLVGRTLSGATATRVQAILVVAFHPPSRPLNLETPVMVSVSVALPVGTWLLLGVLSRRRRPAP